MRQVLEAREWRPQAFVPAMPVRTPWKRDAAGGERLLLRQNSTLIRHRSGMFRIMQTVSGEAEDVT